MDILKAIGQLSDTTQIIELLQAFLSAEEISCLESFCAGTPLPSEQYQGLNRQLDTIFKREQTIQHFLNNEKEEGQTVGQVIFGDSVSTAKDYGVVFSAPITGDVHITHQHSDRNRVILFIILFIVISLFIGWMVKSSYIIGIKGNNNDNNTIQVDQ
ncbi:hypothetical protein BKI52_19355 [marine bacterium AO1-C]|nr:hypothetical protein BKI52_19355 [marine bacterium AO1-C]